MSSASKKSIEIYGRSAIEDELRKLKNADHHQNNQLNRSAFAIGQILVGASAQGVEVGTLADAELWLFQAAIDNDYVKREGKRAATVTIRSGLNKGWADPRNLSHIGKSNGCAKLSDQHSTEMCGSETGPCNCGCEPNKTTHSDDQKLGNARRISAETVPLKGTAGEKYLELRRIEFGRLPSGALADIRFHPQCPIYDGAPNEDTRPALIAHIRDVRTGELTGGIHRTFLREDGAGKADLETQKKALGKYGDNGVVILGKIEPGAVVAETEGIEDGLSIVAATGGVAIATLGDTRLGKICLPADIERIVCGDAKTAKDKSTARQGAQTAADRELRDVRLCFPSDGTGDFNDLLRAQGVAAVASAINLAETVQPDLSDLRFEDDLKLTTPSNQIIKGIFGHGDIGMLCGPSMSGKTFFIYDLAAHIAQGSDWHGRKVKKCSVLIVNYEGKRSFDNRRLAYLQEHGTCGRNLAELTVPAPLGKADGTAGVQAIADAAKKLAAFSGREVGLIELDTWSRASAGYDENSNSEMNQFIEQRIEAIARQTGAAVLGVHHPGKDLGRGARGASSQFAALDFVINIQGEEGAGNPREAVLDKLKDGQVGPLFTYRLKQVHIGNDEDGDLITSCIVEVVNEQASQRRRPSTQAAKALEEFNQVIIAGKGRPAPASDRIPDGVTVVRLGDWQAACARKGLSNSAQDNAKERQKVEKKAFMRAKEDLEKKGWIAVFDGLVWRPDHVGRGQTNNWSDDPETTHQGQTGSDQKNEEYQCGAKSGHAGSNHEMDPAGSQGQRVPTPLGVGPLDPTSDPSGTQPKSKAFPGEHEADFNDAAEEFEVEL